MPTLKVRFPGGRYHATPWGHHVNEGLIEWPPSPWRLLRAFIACGFSSMGWTEIPPVAQQMIRKLSETLPLFHLPEASAAHSRHFMPVGALEKGREKTTLVFDTWANIGEGTLLVNWPCQLEADELDMLERLSKALGYLGRSESWIEAELVLDGSRESGDFNAFPHMEGMHPGREYEQTSLMAATPHLEYQAWRQKQEEVAFKAYPLPEGKKKPPARLMIEREKVMAPYPPDLLSCLTKDTVWWKGHGWSQPPGSRRVIYWRKSDALQVGIPAISKTPDRNPVTMMLLSLTAPSGNQASLPPCIRTLPQAELFHRAMVSSLGRGLEVHCPELTGRDEHGRVLRGIHQHAHTLPLDLDGDGHLDHILVFAGMKLGSDAQRAIHRVKRVWAKGVSGDIQIAVVGYGELDTLRGLPDRMKGNIQSLLGPSGGARVWKSITPFVPPRHLKASGKNTLMGQVNAELSSRGLPEANLIQIDPALTRQLRHFIRRRSRGNAPQPPMDLGLGLRLVLPKPISGPLLLGYASHFGLGLFVPDD